MLKAQKKIIQYFSHLLFCIPNVNFCRINLINIEVFTNSNNCQIVRFFLLLIFIYLIVDLVFLCVMKIINYI